MGKLFSLAAMVLFSLSAKAGSVGCLTDAHSTQTQLSWNDKSVSQIITSPMGYSYLPQMDAPVSESSIPFLKEQTGALKELGDRFQVSWSRRDCELDPKDPWILHCGVGKVEGHPNIQLLGASGFVENQRGSFGTQETWKLRLILGADGGTYFVTVPFAKSFCQAHE